MYICLYHLGYKASTSGQVCHLRKSICGLYHASYNWYFKLSGVLIEYGFVQYSKDHFLFTDSKGDIFMTVLVYVDDLILVDNHSYSRTSFKAFLNQHFNIKDLGSLNYFFDIEVACSNVSIFFCQSKYTIDIPLE